MRRKLKKTDGSARHEGGLWRSLRGVLLAVLAFLCLGQSWSKWSKWSNQMQAWAID